VFKGKISFFLIFVQPTVLGPGVGSKTGWSDQYVIAVGGEWC
jgi:hypothetical protein